MRGFRAKGTARGFAEKRRPDVKASPSLVANYGVQRFTADSDNPSHRVGRLLAEFLGVAGLMVILSGVAGFWRDSPVRRPPYQLVAIAAITFGVYLVAAIYFLGDISVHFDPVVILAFGIRRT